MSDQKLIISKSSLDSMANTINNITSETGTLTLEEMVSKVGGMSAQGQKYVNMMLADPSDQNANSEKIQYLDENGELCQTTINLLKTSPYKIKILAPSIILFNSLMEREPSSGYANAYVIRGGGSISTPRTLANP